MPAHLQRNEDDRGWPQCTKPVHRLAGIQAWGSGGVTKLHQSNSVGNAGDHGGTPTSIEVGGAQGRHP